MLKLDSRMLCEFLIQPSFFCCSGQVTGYTRYCLLLPLREPSGLGLAFYDEKEYLRNKIKG
ncbi:hypothetical protein [Cyclobacterium sp.]|uniref:hypothetical protein n=1 Tax=Cyclobacterium sp. TaxID=1966343 RepID=UPI0019AB12C9|nr:hypothetical protein [Cyclobacterium sp.]MBD3626633.1 hypothetical protein [Cyclobacterium sp.]